MKNISPRQRKILELLTQKGDLTVAEIQQAAGISQATAYREMQAILRAGMARKTPGGLTRAEPSTDHCLHCQRPVHPRLVFHIEQSNGMRQAACCAHCGLLALANLLVPHSPAGTDARQAMTVDFLYGALLNAAQAWYVLGSAVAPCCNPSALAFSAKSDAERFANGFGGEVCDFNAAQAQITRLMHIHPR
jgi:hypothetical protein